MVFLGQYEILLFYAFDIDSFIGFMRCNLKRLQAFDYFNLHDCRHFSKSTRLLVILIILILFFLLLILLLLIATILAIIFLFLLSLRTRGTKLPHRHLLKAAV